MIEPVRLLDGPVAGRLVQVDMSRTPVYTIAVPQLVDPAWDKTGPRIDYLQYILKPSRYHNDSVKWVGAVGHHVGDLMEVRVAFNADLLEQSYLDYLKSRCREELERACGEHGLIPDDVQLAIEWYDEDRQLKQVIATCVAADPNGWLSVPRETVQP